MRDTTIRLLLATALLLTACDGGESPLAPSAESPREPAVEAPSDVIGASLTTWPRIAYTSYRNGNVDVYVMNPQGYEVTRLTTSAKWESTPVWSPNNKRIAFVRPRLVAVGQWRDDIYVINADGTGGRWVLSSPSIFNLSWPTWSPDGSKILVTVTASNTYLLATLDVGTRSMQWILRGGSAVQGQQATYHPSGKRIVYVGVNSNSVEEINTDGTGHANPIAGSSLGGPVYSPDGTRLLFSMAANNGDQELFVLSSNGLLRLTNVAGMDFWPSWSPDGSQIAFASTRNGKLQLYRMKSTGGSATRISRNSYDERSPAYSH